MENTKSLSEMSHKDCLEECRKTMDETDYSVPVKIEVLQRLTDLYVRGLELRAEEEKKLEFIDNHANMTSCIMAFGDSIIDLAASNNRFQNKGSLTQKHAQKVVWGLVKANAMLRIVATTIALSTEPKRKARDMDDFITDIFEVLKNRARD